ncbi:MAG: T9SS type A sorting domain-containing protein [Fibrobacteres bacterium]|nr:T9SS type A sorting domain-containing protein [Fibrobacterota bacterium]
MDFSGSVQMPSCSARVMIQNGSFSYWLKGNVSTSIIIADHSLSRKFDFGLDTNRSIRPIFHATFWPTISKVFVRYIGEISNTEKIQDQVYNLTLKAGLSTRQTILPSTSIIHYHGSRWTKTAWIGGTPANVDLVPDLSYLAKTRFVCNYDTTKIVSTTQITSEYSSWLSSSRNLFDAGNWAKAMGMAGGRPDIGPYPTWAVQWIYTGDSRLAEKTIGNAELACAWPMNFREGNINKKILRDDNLSGIGRVMSISTRPTLSIGSGLDYGYTSPSDRVKLVGSFTSGGWNPDVSHQPDPFSIPYIMTGQFFFLEELWFWAAWDAAYPNGAATVYSSGRGPTGAEGGISDQIRGQAWGIRNRSHAAFLSPDNAPEKKYFTQLLEDAAAVWEGMRDIRTTPLYGTSEWNWGKLKKYLDAGNPPLNQWERGSSSFAQVGYGIDTSVTSEAISNFEQHFMMFALGRATELGFPFGALKSYLAVNYIGQATAEGYNHYLLANGRIPTVKKGGEYFTTWADMVNGYDSSWKTQNKFDLSDADHGYDFLALTALSYVRNEARGDSAWSFAATKILPASVLNNNPKWAIVPRNEDWDFNFLEKNNFKKDEHITLSVSPNPFSENINIYIGGTNLDINRNASLKLYDISGKLVANLTEKIGKEISVSLNRVNLSSSVYFISLEVGKKQINKRIIFVR